MIESIAVYVERPYTAPAFVGNFLMEVTNDPGLVVSPRVSPYTVPGKGDEFFSRWVHVGMRRYLVQKGKVTVFAEDAETLQKSTDVYNSEETWEVAVSRAETHFDTLWQSSKGRYCVTDGTHPAYLESDLEGYVVDIDELKEPVVIGSHGKHCRVGFPFFGPSSDTRVLRNHKLMERFLFVNGVIDKPITYLLPEIE